MRAQRWAVIVSATAAFGIHLRSAEAATWLGTTNGNWNEPTNWSPGGVPPQFTPLEFPNSNQPNTFQNIGAGFAPGAISFTASNTSYKILDGTISLVDTSVSITNLVQGAHPSHYFAAPVAISGPVTLNINDVENNQVLPRLSFREMYGQGSLIYNGGPNGIATVGTASINGPVLVNSGMLRVGGWAYFPFTELLNGALTTSQDVTVATAGTLAGLGSINLARGKKVQINGTLSPGYGALPPDNSVMTINGDVVFGNSSTYFVEDPSVGANDRVTVGGLLDLRGLNDRLLFAESNPFLPHDAIVMNYQNRLGTFDIVDAFGTAVTVIYTSPENSGPGQVIVRIPEPATTSVLFIAAAFTLRCRIRSTHE